MPKQTEKRKRVNLSVVQKLKLIKNIENGASVAGVCKQYGVKKQLVCDIRKSKEKLMKYAALYCVDASSSQSGKVKTKKHMKTGKDQAFNAAVMKWYVQERSSGVNVRGVELLAAATELASHLGYTNFKGSEGWLWRFRNRDRLFNEMEHGEAGDADMASVAPFREKLTRLMSDEGLALSQIYNADETGMFWRSVPKNTQVRRDEDKSKGKKPARKDCQYYLGAMLQVCTD